jgi:hypothetical protein
VLPLQLLPEKKLNRVKKIKLLSPDGKLVEVDKDDIKPAEKSVKRAKGKKQGQPSAINS